MMKDSPILDFCRPRVVIVKNITACPCYPERDSRSAEANLPLLNMEDFPTVMLGTAITNLIRRTVAQTQCPTCDRWTTLTTSTEFVVASDILIVTVQRRLPNGGKDNQPIDVGGNVHILHPKL